MNMWLSGCGKGVSTHLLHDATNYVWTLSCCGMIKIRIIIINSNLIRITWLCASLLYTLMSILFSKETQFHAKEIFDQLNKCFFLKSLRFPFSQWLEVWNFCNSNYLYKLINRNENSYLHQT